MTNNKIFKVFGLIIVTLIVGYLFTWGRSAVEFKFVELASPKGFRTLVLDAQSSGFNPLFGLPSKSKSNLPISTLAVCNALYQDHSSPELGPRNAKISIVEFFDYRCPYCKTLTKILFQLHEDRGIRVIYKEWPILSESSELAARAALGAAVQGKYREFHSQLMDARLLATNAYIKSMSANHGVEFDKLLIDMHAPRTTTALERNSALASELGIIGTPALVVGRTIVQGAITKEQLGRLIDIETSSSRTC